MITIIVMLILVGVTVNVALTGGLFNKAKEAAIKHEVATIQELIVSEKIKLESEKIQAGKAQEEVTVEETLKSINGEEKLNKVTIEGEDYITNAKEVPDNKCYKINPEKLNISTPRGKGETGDIFIVDGKFDVYYIIKGATIPGTNTPETPWYIPTDDEIAEITTKGAYDADGNFAILENEGQSYITISRLVIEETEDTGEAIIYMIAVSDPILTRGAFMYIAPQNEAAEEYAIEAGMIINNWCYDRYSDFSNQIEYNGTFPYDTDFIENSAIHSESYFNRLMASFKGESEEAPASLSEYTINELRYIEANYGHITDDSKSKIRIVDDNIVIKHITDYDKNEENFYTYYFNEQSIGSLVDLEGKSLEPLKWYIQAGGAGGAISLYEGGSPISASDFGEIYCESYFNRILASFNNN